MSEIAKAAGAAEPAAPAEPPPAAAPLASTLHSRGMRMTAARRQVLDAVTELGHSTPEQIHEHVCAGEPGTHLTTVYRNLDVLEEIGLIGHTHIGHGAPVYHPAEHEHVHVVCHRCQAMVPAEASLFDDVVSTLRERHGFHVAVGHLTLSGECADCAAGSDKA